MRTYIRKSRSHVSKIKSGTNDFLSYSFKYVHLCYYESIRLTI